MDLKSYMIDVARRPSFADMDKEDVNWRNHFGETALHVAAIGGDLPAARMLIDAGALLDVAGEDRMTPLHEAIEQGHYEMVALLLERGADPLAEGIYGTAFECPGYESDALMRQVVDRYA